MTCVCSCEPEASGLIPRAKPSGFVCTISFNPYRAALLTPIAKAFSTDIGIEVASLGIQVHGGMGFIEETGAAQHLRDARIAAIYEGTNGIQALDLAMRKDLGKYSDRIGDLELVDFKVRILDGGTGAVTRVLVESRDDTGERWTTIGVSANIIDASFEALYESISYKLMKTEAAGRA